MTGMELRRLKNNKFKEISFFNHFSYGANCFLVHSYRAQVTLFRINQTDFEVDECIDIKGFLSEVAGDTNIVSVKTLPQNPAEIFICTHSSLLVIEVTKFYRPSFGFSQCFSTKLTTLNVIFVLYSINSLW